ncbi:hypothetical protein [Nostoc sp.]|uniref:hypothetical protein n=1 Tax=Nostoc sp. TaxID=1180 RepID=UPI002FF533D0
MIHVCPKARTSDAVEINRAQVLLVNQFWILDFGYAQSNDFGFWIDPDHPSTTVQEG